MIFICTLRWRVTKARKSEGWDCGCAAQLESLKLLSTAERLGLLSTLERLLVSDPAAISSLALPLLVASLGALQGLALHTRGHARVPFLSS